MEGSVTVQGEKLVPLGKYQNYLLYIHMEPSQGGEYFP